MASEVVVMICKLVCKGGKDILEFFSFKIIPRTEKAGTKKALLSNCF